MPLTMNIKDFKAALFTTNSDWAEKNFYVDVAGTSGMMVKADKASFINAPDRSSVSTVVYQEFDTFICVNLIY